MANRLDPWHGAWYHPYSFVDLTVVATPGEDGDGFTVDVSFKVAGRLVVPVRAVFTAPEPRTVVMHITEGEGAGSVVETHATPLGADDRGRPRTAVTEAVVAASDRPGFAFVRRAAPLLRPVVQAAAGRPGATTSPMPSAAGHCGRRAGSRADAGPAPREQECGRGGAVHGLSPAGGRPASEVRTGPPARGRGGRSGRAARPPPRPSALR